MPLAGVTLIERSVRALAGSGAFDVILPVLAERDLDALGRARDAGRGRRTQVAPVVGGAERQDSMRAGLAALGPEIELVAVHDAARCLVSVGDLRAVVAAARKTGAALLGERSRDTIKRVVDDRVVETPDRSECWAAQTPQVIRRDWLEAAMARAVETGRMGTDDVQLVEWIGHPVEMVESTAPNPKITQPEDLLLAERLIEGATVREGDSMRIGQGYDVHQLVPGRRLVLGGVEIPHDRGLEGHSDGDALLHAVADAILGALGEGDLGRHFPSSDERWRGADSRDILRAVVGKMKAARLGIANVDATIVAQVPRLAPHQPAMCASLSEVLAVDPARVNVKVTSTDQLGAMGRGEGIAGMAVVLLEATEAK